jgi:putative heme-binding domain-containing protein
VAALSLNPAESETARLTVLRSVPKAAALLLANHTGAPGIPDKAGGLPTLPPLTGPIRSAVVDALSRQADGPPLLLAKIRQGILSAGDIPAAMAVSWRSTGSPEIRRQAAELLPAPSRDRSAVIAARQTALTLPGNPAKGGQIFQQRCATCHRDGETGAAVGPDRASFRNKGKPLLLLAILDPDREVAPQFARVTLTMKDGTVSAGVCVSESQEAVRLMLPGGQEFSAPRGSIARMDRESASLMPTGIEEGLSNQELADLLAWLSR